MKNLNIFNHSVTLAISLLLVLTFGFTCMYSSQTDFFGTDTPPVAVKIKLKCYPDKIEYKPGETVRVEFKIYIDKTDTTLYEPGRTYKILNESRIQSVSWSITKITLPILTTLTDANPEVSGYLIMRSKAVSQINYVMSVYRVTDNKTGFERAGYKFRYDQKNLIPFSSRIIIDANIRLLGLRMMRVYDVSDSTSTVKQPSKQDVVPDFPKAKEGRPSSRDPVINRL